MVFHKTGYIEAACKNVELNYKSLHSNTPPVYIDFQSPHGSSWRVAALSLYALSCTREKHTNSLIKNVQEE